MVLLLRPLAALIFSTEVPYLRANPQSVSDDLTTQVRLLRLAAVEDEDPVLLFFFGGAEATLVLRERELELAVVLVLRRGGGASSTCVRLDR
jgi:hypothetical protein